jgi:hypothetical protein
VTPSQLIGAAGATSVRRRLSALTDSDGVARYLLDRLTGEQVAASDFSPMRSAKGKRAEKAILHAVLGLMPGATTAGE